MKLATVILSTLLSLSELSGCTIDVLRNRELTIEEIIINNKVRINSKGLCIYENKATKESIYFKGVKIEYVKKF